MPESTRPKTLLDHDSNVYRLASRRSDITTAICEMQDADDFGDNPINATASQLPLLQQSINRDLAQVIKFRKKRKKAKRRDNKVDYHSPNLHVIPEVSPQGITSIAGGVRKVISPASLRVDRSEQAIKERAKLVEVFGQMNMEPGEQPSMTIEEAAKFLAQYIDKENEDLYKGDLFSEYEKGIAYNILWRTVAQTIIKTIGARAHMILTDKRIDAYVKGMIEDGYTVAKWKSILAEIRPKY